MELTYAHKLKMILSVIYIFAFSIAFAQTGTIKGTVKDGNGNALSGASVTVQGSSRGTITNNDGGFTFSINPGTYTVVASFVGYANSNQSTTVTAGGTSTVDFTLIGNGDLGAVTVIGTRSTRTRTETAV